MQEIKNQDYRESGIPNQEYEEVRFTNCQFAQLDLTNCVFVDCEFHDCDLSMANLGKADFRTALNYTINPDQNRIKKARFTVPGVLTLLDLYDIKIEL